MASLHREFPTYHPIASRGENWDWSEIEILYGRSLSEEELASATRLKWIHIPSIDIHGFPLHEMRKREEILLTNSKGQNVSQIAQFVMGGILLFAKQFFHWPKATRDPKEFWDWPLKETLWDLREKLLLQVGLGEVGTAIVKLATSFGMKSWGVRRERSFHPYCQKTFTPENLRSVLPVVDIVVIALPMLGKLDPKPQFGKKEFSLMKKDSILIVIGSSEEIDEAALAEEAKRGKFRGILLDSFRNPPPAKDSPLWKIPNALLTPSVAPLPESTAPIAFRLFRKNLRLYVPGKINEMVNRVLG